MLVSSLGLTLTQPAWSTSGADQSPELWPLKAILLSLKPSLPTALSMSLENEWMKDLPSAYSIISKSFGKQEVCSLSLLEHICFRFPVPIFLNSPPPCPDAWRCWFARFWVEWWSVPAGSLLRLNMWSDCSLLRPGHQLTPVRRKKARTPGPKRPCHGGMRAGPPCHLWVLVWACLKWGGGRKVVYISVIH